MNFHNTMSLLLSPWFARTRHSLIAIIPRGATSVCDFCRNYGRGYGGYLSARLQIESKERHVITTKEDSQELLSLHQQQHSRGSQLLGIGVGFSPSAVPNVGQVYSRDCKGRSRYIYEADMNSLLILPRLPHFLEKHQLLSSFVLLGS